MIYLSLIILLVPGVLSDTDLHYDITIIPDLETLKFKSVTTIIRNVEEPKEAITFTTENLSIGEVSVSALSRGNEKIDSSYTNENGKLVIKFSNQLSKENYLFAINYTGPINTNYEGFYLAKYVKENETENEETQERKIALVDLRYDKAKTLFPCDENFTKPATYALKIVRPKNYISVSNMAKTSTTEYDNQNDIDTFATTDPIPVYLLSFAIIDFAETQYNNVAVYSLKKSETEFLAQFSSEAIQKFQEIEPLKLTKLHQVVVPDNCLSKDILENIGLIIYKESSVFYNSERENTEDKQEIVKIISHAVASQWLKDDSSFEWWPNYWIQAGTTILYQNNLVDALEPSWRFKEQYLTGEISNALQFDIENESVSLILGENETPDIFSQIHSTKSYALVRMLTYLPLPGNILDEINNPLVLSWTENKGYPILNVNKNYNNVFTFAQEDIVRSVPVNIIFENGRTHDDYDLILEQESKEETFDEFSTASWYIVNSNRLGYFRVNYDIENWKNIAKYLSGSNINNISPVDRAVLIEDAFYLVKSEKLSINVYLDIVNYLKRESDFIPIYAFIKTANEIKSLLAKTTTQEKFEKFAVDLVHHLYEHLGTSLKPSEEHLETLARIRVLTWLCKFGHEQCLQEMSESLSQLKSVHPDLQDLVYCGGMHNASLEKFNFLKEQLTIHQKKRILRSMACTSDKTIISYYINAITDDSLIFKLNDKDKIDAFSAILEGSDYGVTAALNFTKQHLENILRSFSDKEITTMFVALSKKLITEDEEQKIDAIIECLNDDQKINYEALFATVKSNIQENRKWQNRNVAALQKWLDENTEKSTTTTTEGDSSTPPSTTPSPDSATQFTISILTAVTCIIFRLL